LTTAGLLLSVASAATGRTAAERPDDAALPTDDLPAREGNAGAKPARLAGEEAAEETAESAERARMVEEAIVGKEGGRWGGGES